MGTPKIHGLGLVQDGLSVGSFSEGIVLDRGESYQMLYIFCSDPVARQSLGTDVSDDKGPLADLDELADVRRRAHKCKPLDDRTPYTGWATDPFTWQESDRLKGCPRHEPSVASLDAAPVTVVPYSAKPYLE